MRTKSLFLAATCLVSLSGHAHAQQSSFAYTFIATPDASTNTPDPTLPVSANAVVYGLTDTGIAVGDYGGGSNTGSFSYNTTTGAVTTLTFNGITGGYIAGISSNGINEIVTNYNNTTQTQYSYIYNTNTSTATPIADPNAVYNGSETGTFVSAVNNSGQVLGNYTTSNVGFNQNYLYTPGGGYTDISVPNAEYYFYSGINDAGLLVGGYIDLSGNYNGFVQLADGTVETYDNPFAVNGTHFVAINNSDQILGFYLDGNEDSNYFLFNYLTDTYTYFGGPEQADSSAFGGSAIFALNDLQQIGGTAYAADNGPFFPAFVAVEQVPEPATMAILGTAAAGLLGVTRRRRHQG